MLLYCIGIGQKQSVLFICPVKEYYEKKYSEPETVVTEAITEEELNNQDDQEKHQDGFTLILQRQI